MLDDQQFVIKPHSFFKLYRQKQNSKIPEINKRVKTPSNKRLEIMHFNKAHFLLQLPEEIRTNRTQNISCRSICTTVKSSEKRKYYINSPKDSQLTYKILNQKEQELPLEIHSQMPVSQINPKYVIQQRQGCNFRLPNFKLQLTNQINPHSLNK